MNIDKYSDMINNNGKKNSKVQKTTEVNVNQNWLGQMRYWMQIPSEVTFEVGISLAMLTVGPKIQTMIIIVNACFFVNETLWNTEMRICGYIVLETRTCLWNPIDIRMQMGRKESWSLNDDFTHQNSQGRFMYSFCIPTICEPWFTMVCKSVTMQANLQGTFILGS